MWTAGITNASDFGLQRTIRSGLGGLLFDACQLCRLAQGRDDVRLLEDLIGACRRGLMASQIPTLASVISSIQQDQIRGDNELVVLSAMVVGGSII
jgi:hypothetical protein